jgi:hypothetical protein
MEWLEKSVRAEEKIGSTDLDVLTVTDDLDEAVELMVAARDMV